MMSTTQQSNDSSIDYKSPEGWHWGIGNTGSGHYTKWLYTDKMLYQDGQFGWECQIWHDSPGKHHVQFIQYTRIKPDGDLASSTDDASRTSVKQTSDPEYDYPTRTRSFDTKREAIKYAQEAASELR